MRRRLPVAALLVLVLVAVPTVVAAAILTENLNAGDTQTINCPGHLGWARLADNQGRVHCNAPTTTLGSTTTTVVQTTTTQPSGGAGCGLASVAFCDTFNSARAGGGRDGDLGPGWGASRFDSGQNVAHPSDQWTPSTASVCEQPTPIKPPNDIQICNGQLHDTMSDGGGVKSLAMYPKQPFDFAGRTGTITFDVSNNSQGSHAAWPELWMSDKPIPDPFTHLGTDITVPQNGWGLRFSGCTDSNGNGSTCPHGDAGVGVASAAIVRNYVVDDADTGPAPTVIGVGDVLKSGPGQMNHYEIRVNVGQITIFGTDAYDPTSQAQPPVHEIAFVPNANLPLTRGLVWLEDDHYNGCKFNSQCNNAFTWDNLGFDGPVLPKDLGFDVPDCLCNPDTNIDGQPIIDLGWAVNPAGGVPTKTVIDPGVSGIANATGALLVFDEWSLQQGFTVHLSVNGHAIDHVPPFNPNSPATTDFVPVPLADIQAGDNQVTFGVDSGVEMNFANVSLILVGAG